MKHVVITADDFGLTRSLNDGIIKAYEEGIVTGVSILPTGFAFEEAIEWLKSNRIVDVGVHLSLTVFRPLTDTKEIATLVTKKGHFLKRYQFLLKFIIGRISLDEVYIELKRQLEKVRNAGLNIVHISSHEHIHMMPGILEIFARLAREYSIPAMRCLQSDKIVGEVSFGKLYRHLVSLLLGRRARIVLKDNRLLIPDHLYGFLNARRLTEKVLIEILNSLEDGLTEIVSHPGFLSPELLKTSRWHINCEDELYALTSRKARNRIDAIGAKLTTYQDYSSNRSHP